jgi:hypothetical protein
MDNPGNKSPRGGRDFSAHIQNGPGAHQNNYTMDTGSFTRVKRLEHDVSHAHPSNAKVKETVELHPSLHLLPSWQDIQ